MGVLACERLGCDNVLCDLLINDKYICNDCAEEFKAEFQYTGTLPKWKILALFQEFMDEHKCLGISGNDKYSLVNVSEFVERHRRVELDSQSSEPINLKLSH